jgi:hypothetical protein
MLGNKVAVAILRPWFYAWLPVSIETANRGRFRPDLSPSGLFLPA